MCSVTLGDAADFKIVNVQDSDAQIDDNATTDEPSYTELVIPFTPPSGCEQVEAFMLGTANTDIVFYDDFQVWQAGRGIYPLPSWVTRPDQIIDVRSFPRGTSGPAADFDWRADEQRSRSLSWGLNIIIISTIMYPRPCISHQTAPAGTEAESSHLIYLCL